jgi:hypothetical protein
MWEAYIAVELHHIPDPTHVANVAVEAVIAALRAWLAESTVVEVVTGLTLVTGEAVCTVIAPIDTCDTPVLLY